MNAHALIALCAIGQCLGGSCPTAPSMGGFGGYSHAVPMVPMWSQSPALIHQADAPAASVGQGGAWTIERRYRAANGGIVEAGRDDFGRARWRYLVLPPTPCNPPLVS